MTGDLLALYLVTDAALAGERGVIEVCRLALRAGVRLVQLRDKQASDAELIVQARALRALCREHGAYLLVNDRVEVAAAAGADGVHLGQGDAPPARARQRLGPDAIIGVSVRTPEEARRAERDGADYIAANLVFPTATKTDLPGPLGLAGVRALRDASHLPLVAIGGINATNAAEVVAAGADGVAVVSAVMAAPDPAAACRGLLQAVREGRRRRGPNP
ncbi:MAG: thiamine phosphate synthase [Myxococcales bacterium]|nr:thiamine phosphate synthase [Myxococcales bacterium]